MTGTTYKSTQVTRGDSVRAVTPGVYSVYGSFKITTALTTGDVIQMCAVPIGARVIDVKVEVPRWDTGTSGGFCVGDGTTTNRFITATTAGQTGSSNTIVQYNVYGGNQTQYTVNDTIDIAVATAPQSGATNVTFTMVAVMAIDN